MFRFADFVHQLVLKTRGEGKEVKFEYDAVSDSVNNKLIFV